MPNKVKKTVIEEKVIEITEREFSNLLSQVVGKVIDAQRDYSIKLASNLCGSVVVNLFHPEIVKQIQEERAKASNQAPAPAQAQAPKAELKKKAEVKKNGKGKRK